MLPLAPLLSGWLASDALDELEAAGIAVSTEGLAAPPQFVFLLAEFHRRICEEWEQEGEEPEEGYVSSDDELVEFAGRRLHRADFRMQDPASALRALADHEGVVQDRETSEYRWDRPEEPGSRLPFPDVIAHWDVIGDHLVVTCDREDSFGETRALTQSIPGVELVDMHTEPFRPRGLDAVAGQVPRDDLPGIDELNAPRTTEGSPEFAEKVATLQRLLLRDWIDRESARFNGMTPRAACATDAGARRVKYLIRSRPLFHPSVPEEFIESLRREAFDEFGLNQGIHTGARPSLQVWPAANPVESAP